MAMSHDEFYSAANLTGNPFRSTPVSEADPRKGVWVGYKEEQNRLIKLLLRCRADQVGNINFGMLYGNYGVGKSHALLWSQYYVMKMKKDDFNSLAFYIPTLKKDKGQMSFAAAFYDDIVCKSNIVNDVLVYRQFLDELIIEYKRDKGIGPEASRAVILEKILPSTDLLNLGRDLLNCDDEKSAKALLSAKGDYAALLLFSRLTNLFVFEYSLPSGKRRWKKAIYLFIDELDLLSRVTAKEAREVNDLLRHLYDSCPDCFGLILGFTATAAELGILFADYVLSRVNRQIILDFLQPDEAKGFIKEVLDTARINPTVNNGYFPFTEEAVTSIVSQIVSITPRKLVNMMQQVLEEVRLADIDPSAGNISTKDLDDNDIWSELS